MSVDYLPIDPIKVNFTATSTAFQLVNDTGFVKRYYFNAGQVCHIRRGTAGVSAATTDDFRMSASATPVIFYLRPGEGVRVIRATADGTLQIGAIDS